MAKDIKQRVAVIAGREYPLHYALDERRAIERELKKSLWEAITSALFDDLVTVLRVGIGVASLKDAAIEKRLQQHIDEGSPLDAVVRTVFWAVVEAGLVGGVKDADALRRLMPDPAEELAEDEEDDPGKAGPATAKASSGY